MASSHKQALRILELEFGDRFRQAPLANREVEKSGILASVLPLHAEEVVLLSEVAGHHSLQLIPVGAGTAPGEPSVDNGILIRFDLMSGVRLPDSDEGWIEAEPGASWLKLDNELRRLGSSLAVYPTSAPRAMVGGWMATDGLGVGSFEYGRLWENALTADVVLPGGDRREVEGWQLGDFFGTGRAEGVVVRARLRTRRSTTDRTFAAAFREPGGIVGAVAELAASEVPLWHLGFVNPIMAAARGLRTLYVLFGVYPSQRDGEGWWRIRKRVVKSHGGIELGSREAWRVWGERFFPVAPSHPTPSISREFVYLDGLQEALESRSKEAVQCTVSRSGEALLLTLDA